ncbi:acyltransferase family protein, partial [Dialister invisus]
MISSESKKGKKLHIEFLRFFCIWLVMFTHTSTAGFSLYLLRPESFFFPFYIAVPFWVKTAVPIFFMISGALLLKKEETISVIFKKRIWRFAQIIFIFSLINYLYFYHGLNLSFFGH